MNTNPEIFKAYDIRGVYNEDFNDESAYKLGLAYGTMRQEEIQTQAKLKVVVGSGNIRANRFYEKVGFRLRSNTFVHESEISNVYVKALG